MPWDCSSVPEWATERRFLPSSLPDCAAPHQAQLAHIPAHVLAHLGAQGAHAQDRLGTGWGHGRRRGAPPEAHLPRPGTVASQARGDPPLLAPTWLLGVVPYHKVSKAVTGAALTGNVSAAR